MRILIAGLGAIGQRHARNLRAMCGTDLDLLAYRRRRLRHVVTEALERDGTRDVEAELGVRVFEDFDEGLRERPDAVFVCTPSSQHLELARRAAAAGCHLFIEKPVSHSLEGVDQLRETVHSKGLIAVVGCQWRLHPCVQWLRGCLQEGTLGRLVSAEIDYAEYLPDWHPYEDYRVSYASRAELGGGVVLTQIHDYDLAWWLFGAPTIVTATGGHLSELEIDVEDTIEADLEGGTVPVRIRQSFAARPSLRVITVVGERGAVKVDLLAARVSTGDPVMPIVSFGDYQRNRMFIEEVRHFLTCLAGTETPVVSLDDGIAVLRLAIAARTAMRTGHTVRVS